MAAFKVVVAQEAIQITLDLTGADVPSLAALHSEALIEQRAVHAFDEAVGAWALDLGSSMLDVFHSKQELVWVAFVDAAELATVVREHCADFHSECFVERQDAIAEQISGSDWHLGGVDLCKGQRAEHIDDDLHVHLANTLERAPVERVLVQ